MTDDAVDPALAAALDELGAASLDEFVATRDRLARVLKADGKTAEATALRSRRRPSVVAWSVNQVALDRGDLVDALYAAADEVRAAIERGDGDGLRTAMRAQRSRAAELTDLAVDRAASVSPNPGGHREAIGRTWEAAAADDALRESVSSGMLSTDLQPGATVSGTPSLPDGAAPPKAKGRAAAAPGRALPTAPTSTGPTTTGAPRDARRTRGALPRDELAVRRAEETLADARRALAEVTAAAATADDDLARATRSATRAHDELERARRRVTRAEQTLAERTSR